MLICSYFVYLLSVKATSNFQISIYVAKIQAIMIQLFIHWKTETETSFTFKSSNGLINLLYYVCYVLENYKIKLGQQTHNIFLILFF